MCAANKHYPSYEDYLWAVADAMAEEYRAIVNAGFVLQLDCPDIPMIAHTRGWQAGKRIYGVKGHAELHIQAINRAIKGLPPGMIRLHMCWGNYSGPHHHDVALSEILEPVLAANVAACSFEGANPQHEHEWTLFEKIKLAPDKIIIPGVIDTKTNVLEHPELVAQRIERYAGLVGRERVIAGTDCGFGTFVGFGAVHPKVAWLKLGSLVQGAQLASKHLWSYRRAEAGGTSRSPFPTTSIGGRFSASTLSNYRFKFVDPRRDQRKCGALGESLQRLIKTANRISIRMDKPKTTKK